MKAKIIFPDNFRFKYDNDGTIHLLYIIKGKIIYLGRIKFNENDFKILCENKDLILQNSLVTIPKGFKGIFNVTIKSYDGIILEYVSKLNENEEPEYAFFYDLLATSNSNPSNIYFEEEILIYSIKYIDNEYEFMIKFYAGLLPIGSYLLYYNYSNHSSKGKTRIRKMMSPDGLIAY